MKLIVDTKRAKLIMSHLQDAFVQKKGVLAAVDNLVENQIPKGIKPLSRDHALFLFYTVVNDHGVKSSIIYRRSKELFRIRRELFEPSSVIENFSDPADPTLMDTTGKFIGARYPKEATKTWYLNSKRLGELFAGDPRNLFRCSEDAPKLLKEIKSFRGYGPKTGGMLLRAIVGLGFTNPKGLENVLVPVDIHDSRISFLTGIVSTGNGEIRSNKEYYSHVRDIQKIILETCNSLGLPWLDVDRALWLIGSQACARKRCHLCPIHDFCRIGKNNKLSPSFDFNEDANYTA